ncbi:MAG: CDP-diacylglycerol--glycerol-3-phosphate 3-phosphatidyltransferase [Treponema sp.]|uniref:CDP-diacylglycerol--glycerol-3-phosphate 3-phosphatidyltransferase n=1 Tax=Treponema sp. TaxID=166 RepID=UPI003FA2DB76
MNIANFFTASRIAAAPLFLFLYYLPRFAGISEQLMFLIIIPLFIYMEFTDFLDGFFARKLKQVSDFGKLFDPFADVVANLTVLLAFMLTGFVPIPIFIIILYRELSILFLRMLARGNGITIAAKKGGKLKTVCYIFAEGFTLLIELLAAFSLVTPARIGMLTVVNKILYGLAAVLSIVSFFDYLLSYRKKI